MNKLLVDVEKIIQGYGNKYKAIIVGAKEARRLKELQKKHLFDPGTDHVLESMKRLLDRRIKYQEK